MTEPRPPDFYPPVHNLLGRWDRNENFVDREDAIRSIELILRDHGMAVVRSEPSLLVSGKTAIVIEYAHRYHIHYDVVWVFDYLDPIGLVAQHAQLGRAIREQGIADGRRWLLIVDGVDDADDTWARFCGRYPTASVDLLLTARQAGGDSDEHSVTLGPLDRGHSALLLTMIAPMVGSSWADALADLLAGQPALLWEVGLLIAAGDVAPRASHRLLTMLLPADERGSPPDPGGLRAIQGLVKVAVTVRDDAGGSPWGLGRRSRRLAGW